jgi:chemotaxis signal transduction protein
MDLRRRFRLPEAPIGRRTRIMLVGNDEAAPVPAGARGAAASPDPVGLLVDEVVQVYRLTDAEIEHASVLGGEQPPHIAGIGRPPGSLLILLDLDPILAVT